jgi:hypothetical protein
MNEETSHYREFILFYSVLFFTCIVGIIELLPEFESLNSVFTWHWFSLTALYFGLLFGITLSMIAVPRLYSYQHNFRSYLFDYFLRKRSGKILWGLLIVLAFFVFVILYLVKIQLIT